MTGGTGSYNANYNTYNNNYPCYAIGYGGSQYGGGSGYEFGYLGNGGAGYVLTKFVAYVLRCLRSCIVLFPLRYGYGGGGGGGYYGGMHITLLCAFERILLILCFLYILLYYSSLLHYNVCRWGS